MTDDEIKAIRTIYDRGYTTTAANDIPKLLDEIERLRAENLRLRDAVTLGMHYLRGRYPVPVKEKEVLAQMQTVLDSKE